MTLLYEALGRIQETAIKPPEPAGAVRDMLRCLLRGLDPFSDYLSPREYQAYLASKDEKFAGVGMDIRKDRQHRIICRPFPGSAAEQAGVLPGDELLAVNGTPVDGLSLYSAGAMIRGLPGTTVTLRLRAPLGGERSKTEGAAPALRNGPALPGFGEPGPQVRSGRTGAATGSPSLAGPAPRELRIRRSRTRAVSVLHRTHRALGAEVIEILGFTASTPDELRDLAPELDDSLPLLVDLRGNAGGSLQGGMGAARLFLDKGELVCALGSREGKQEFRAREAPLFHPPSLILLQDRDTASAAELFIAALTGNGRAVSLGQRSFGKGLAQRFIPLEDGSALLLSYAEILPPDGTGYHGKGLVPTHGLAGDLMGAPARGTALVRMLIQAGALTPSFNTP